MPLQIIRQDITKIECDAIVNPSNCDLVPSGGVDLAIHKGAGKELLEYCKAIGGCNAGKAVITPAFKLPCKYVIHTVGPQWNCENSEYCVALLKSCYQESLTLAIKNQCQSVAMPLISTGLYGFPQDKALKIATGVIQDFLFENEMTVYLVVYDKKSFTITEKIFSDIKQLIDDAYVDEHSDYVRSNAQFCRRASRYEKKIELFDVTEEGLANDDFIAECKTMLPCTSLEEMLSSMDESFAVTLLKLIDLKKMTDVECYKKANVSKQTWYKIMNDKDYKPSKNTVIAFAISLELTIEETERLLKTVGFTLSKSNKFDIIIEYFILNENYNIFEINETLFKFDQVGLGV
ncbi:MAG: macro domain-containing protein [Clostridia bacterium]|nr:macro domain-containing protein [Clostridia bacterium]